jgi:O-antigen/teichoic acid export membrane protein
MMLRKTFKNFFVLLSGTLAGQFFLFLGVTFVARLFGPAVFGLWNFAQTYTMYLFRLNELGLEVIGIKKISTAVEPIPEIIMNTIAIRVVLAIVLSAVTAILFLLDLFPKQTGVLVLISSISVLPIALTVEWAVCERISLLCHGIGVLKRCLGCSISNGLLCLKYRDPNSSTVDLCCDEIQGNVLL